VLGQPRPGTAAAGAATAAGVPAGARQRPRTELPAVAQAERAARVRSTARVARRSPVLHAANRGADGERDDPYPTQVRPAGRIRPESRRCALRAARHRSHAGRGRRAHRRCTAAAALRADAAAAPRLCLGAWLLALECPCASPRLGGRLLGAGPPGLPLPARALGSPGSRLALLPRSLGPLNAMIRQTDQAPYGAGLTRRTIAPRGDVLNLAF